MYLSRWTHYHWLVDWESGYCIRVGWHVYLTIILEIMHFSVNELKRCFITLHLSLNDLLRRSVDFMRSAYTNHYQTRTIRRNRNSNKNRFIRILRFQSYRPFKICGDFCLSFSFNSELGFLIEQFSKKNNYVKWWKSELL